MKRIIIFLIPLTILFISCIKNEGLNSLPNYPVSPAVNMTPDSLRGREFLFDSLTWIDNDFGYPVFYLEDSHLFQLGRHISVAIKHDTSSIWEQANIYNGGPGSLGYLYRVSAGVLAVWPNPAQPELLGKRFSLNVRFL